MTATESLRASHRAGDYQQVLAAVEDPARLEPAGRLVYALALLVSGQDQAAAPLLEEVLPMEPEGPAWAADRALASFLLGDHAGARRALEALIATGEAEPVAYGRLAVVALAEGDLEEAAANYREAIEREPGRAEWHHNLGGVLVRQGRLEEALANYERALSLRPGLPQAQEGRKQVLHNLDRLGELIAELEAALEADPEDLELRLRLAQNQVLAADYPAATATLRERLKPVEEVADAERPEQLRLVLALADLAAGRGAPLLALRALNRAERLAEPDQAPRLQARQAAQLAELGRPAQARERIEAATAACPDDPAVQRLHARVLSELGEYEASDAILASLAETYPGDASLRVQRGRNLMWIGRLEAAKEVFQEAAALEPGAVAQLADLGELPEDASAVDLMAGMADNVLLPDETRSGMAFGVSRVLDKKGEADRAFRYLALANELEARHIRYDPEGFSDLVGRIAAVFSAEFFETRPPLEWSRRTPVFVVGMPRSGTTLTEQILSSHPEVFGAGELPYIPRITRQLPRLLGSDSRYPEAARRMSPELRQRAATFYLQRLADQDREAPFVVDKLPHNFEHLGLIADILPAAKVIHVRRDPRDTALSNFQQNFKAKHGGMGFAFDLEHIARQLNDYHRIMAHWREVLPIPMLEIDYEELVADQEGVTRRMLDFLGLEWDENVLQFHSSERAVRTASVTQVRQPIYQTSRQKWRKYADHLEPLTDALDPETLRRYP